MRLLVEVGYDSMLFAKGANAPGIIAAFEEAQIVNEVGPWSHRKYQIKEEQRLNFKLIPDDDVVLPETSSDALDVIVKLDKEKSDKSVECYKLQQEVKKLTEELEKLKANQNQPETLEELK